MKPAAEFKTILLLGCGLALGIWYHWNDPPIGVQSRLSAASRYPLNPLAPPSRRLEGIREILCLVHDLAVADSIILTVYAGRPWYVIVYSVIQRSPFPRIRLTLKPDGLPG
jgi:hypothetical protein